MFKLSCIVALILVLSGSAFAGGNCTETFTIPYYQITVKDVPTRTMGVYPQHTVDVFPVARLRGEGGQFLFYGKNGQFYQLGKNDFTTEKMPSFKESLPKPRCQTGGTCNPMANLYSLTQAFYRKTGRDLEVFDETKPTLELASNQAVRGLSVQHVLYDMLREFYDAYWPEGYKEGRKPRDPSIMEFRQIGLRMVQKLNGTSDKSAQLKADLLPEFSDGRYEAQVTKTKHYEDFLNHLKSGGTGMVSGVVDYTYKGIDIQKQRDYKASQKDSFYFMRNEEVYGLFLNLNIEFKKVRSYRLRHYKHTFSNFAGNVKIAKWAIENIGEKGINPTMEHAIELLPHFLGGASGHIISAIKMFPKGPLAGQVLVFDSALGHYNIVSLDHLYKNRKSVQFYLVDVFENKTE